jgi:hypothetical protein
MEANLLELQQTLRQQGILISFSGRFSQAVIEDLGDAVKRYLETEAISQNETYNVFSIFIEQTQNIKNYGSKYEARPNGTMIAGSGIVTIGKTNDGYFVSSGNLIENDDADRLRERIKALAGLDKTALKRLYKEQLRKEPEPGATGAGLGLIDMAKRSSRPLEFSILPQDRQFSFFTLKVHV